MSKFIHEEDAKYFSLLRIPVNSLNSGRFISLFLDVYLFLYFIFEITYVYTYKLWQYLYSNKIIKHFISLTQRGKRFLY